MRVVVLTGAGISAESGVRTFRDAGGLWEGHAVEQVATPEGFEADPDLVLRFYDERRRAVASVQPNAAHLALARLEEAIGDDLTVVTQNIDDLHERAGTRRLVHMHGELRRALCASCGARMPCTGDLIDRPACAVCGQRMLRPDVVWFGEMPYGLDRIERAVAACDVFAAIGTSGVVYPAAGYVALAAAFGARTIELNLDPTGAGLLFDDVRIGRATEIVPAWVDEILAAPGSTSPDGPALLSEVNTLTATAFIDAVRAALPAGTVLTTSADVERYSHDDAEWAPYAAPAAVVLAECVDDVVAAVRVAAEHGVPIVPRGAGTGLSGGANATAGCLVLSLERMTAIREVNVEERYAVVEAGVLNDDLRRAVAQHGLWYPPDPASQSISTIGGNVATNAGGICCVKYGVTRDYVLGVTVVLADGSVATLGRTTAKGVTGYDLTALMVGSEGTLGLIVDVTVKLLPLAGREERAVVGYFGSLSDAGRAVAAVSAASIVPSALELIDRLCLTTVAQWQQWTLPENAHALLLAKVDEVGIAGEELADRIAALFVAAGGVYVERATDPVEVDRLFLARRLAYPALERLGPVLTEDVCVPRAAVPEMLERIEAIAAAADVVIANIAHAGDGNLHPLIIAPETDYDAKERAKHAFDRIVEACRDLGGTVTGEHGVGLLKLSGAAAELSPVVLGMHAAIKQALDPRGILNPGKAFPDEGRL